MRILFTGASSFTGSWFVRELASAGHEITMTLRCDPSGYDGVRGDRVRDLAGCGTTAIGVRFGGKPFRDLIESEAPFDLLCHHAADVTDYRSPDFDTVGALGNNVAGLPGVLGLLREKGCTRVLLTGSVFEGGEGAGSEGRPAFSPYGLSKQLTREVFRWYCRSAGLRLGRFVIPNPFGPFEEPRFVAYLFRTWYAGETPAVNTPLYVRDNIHASLLARAYRDFAENLPQEAGESAINPSGYVESQGDFALRVAREMEPRLGRSFPVVLNRQTEFTEPRIRINTDPVDVERLGWTEADAWDGLAAYYQGIYGADANG